MCLETGFRFFDKAVLMLCNYEVDRGPIINPGLHIRSVQTSMSFRRGCLENTETSRLGRSLDEVLSIGTRTPQKPPTKPRAMPKDLKSEIQKGSKSVLSSATPLTEEQEAKLIDGALDFVDSIPKLYATDKVDETVGLVCYMSTTYILTEAGIVSEKTNADFQIAAKGYLGHVGLQSKSIPDPMNISAKFTRAQKDEMKRSVFQTTDMMTWIQGYITEINEIIEAFRQEDYQRIAVIAGKFFLRLAAAKLFEMGPINILQKVGFADALGIQSVFSTLDASASDAGISNSITGVMSQLIAPGEDSSVTQEIMSQIFPGRAIAVGGAMLSSIQPSAALRDSAERAWQRTLDRVSFGLASNVEPTAAPTSGQIIAGLFWGLDVAIGPVGRLLIYIITTAIYGMYKCGKDNKKSILGFLASNPPPYVKYLTKKILKSMSDIETPTPPPTPPPPITDQQKKQYKEDLEDFKRKKQELGDELQLLNDDYQLSYNNLKELVGFRITHRARDGTVTATTTLAGSSQSFYRQMSREWDKVSASQREIETIFTTLRDKLEKYPVANINAESDVDEIRVRSVADNQPRIEPMDGDDDEDEDDDDGTGVVPGGAQQGIVVD